MSVSQVVGDSVKKEFAFKVCKFGPTSFFFNFFRSQTHQQNEVFCCDRWRFINSPKCSDTGAFFCQCILTTGQLSDTTAYTLTPVDPNIKQPLYSLSWSSITVADCSQADVFALAVTLAAMCKGCDPYDLVPQRWKPHCVLCHICLHDDFTLKSFLRKWTPCDGTFDPQLADQCEYESRAAPGGRGHQRTAPKPPKVDAPG